MRTRTTVAIGLVIMAVGASPVVWLFDQEPAAFAIAIICGLFFAFGFGLLTYAVGCLHGWSQAQPPAVFGDTYEDFDK